MLNLFYIVMPHLALNSKIKVESFFNYNFLIIVQGADNMENLHIFHFPLLDQLRKLQRSDNFLIGLQGFFSNINLVFKT